MVPSGSTFMNNGQESGAVRLEAQPPTRCPARRLSYRRLFCRPASTRSRPGFTLIELLVVIAIIAILAAILLPVFAAAREHARRNACTSNLEAISQALTTYQQDQGGYPPGLWQPNVVDGSVNTKPAQSWTTGLLLLLGKNSPRVHAAPAGDVYAAQLLRTPAYLAGIQDLHCPDNPNSDQTDIATPTGDSTGVFPEGYDNYDGPDPFGYRSFSPADRANMVQTYEYTLDRLPPDDYGFTPFGASTPADYQDPNFTRQLRFLHPDVDTVVTWCAEHRDRVNGVPTPSAVGKNELVLFLDGKVMPKHYAVFSSGSAFPTGMGLINETSP